jgi:hypothetical protein
MNAEIKRKPGRPRKVALVPPAEKPALGLPDPLDAAQEACRLAQEGNVRLSRSIDACRLFLQGLSQAEYDHEKRREITAAELRAMAAQFLSNQGWRKPIQTTRAGDRTLNGLEA